MIYIFSNIKPTNYVLTLELAKYWHTGSTSHGSLASLIRHFSMRSIGQLEIKLGTCYRQPEYELQKASLATN